MSTVICHVSIKDVCAKEAFPLVNVVLADAAAAKAVLLSVYFLVSPPEAAS